MNRRHFIGSSLAAAAFAQAQQQPLWPSKVIDIHLHPRSGDMKEIDHVRGTETSQAVLLPSAKNESRAVAVVQEYPKQFVRFTNADVRQPDAIQELTAGVKSGAIGFGELKYPVALDSEEMKRVYALAADLQVPVLIHFQESSLVQGAWNTGFTRLPAVLKAFPRTTFIAHANSWWANISADADKDVDYPTGPIKPGGLSDKMLSDYPNVYGDLSANSGRNALARDPAFAAAFVRRHANKLMFGSDCGCRDGHGADQPQTPLQGKCTGRATLTLLKAMTTPELFRQIAWDNAHKLLKIAQT